MSRITAAAARILSPISTMRAAGLAVSLPISSAWLIASAILRGCRQPGADIRIRSIVDPAARYRAAAGDADLTGAISRRFTSVFMAAAVATAWAILLPKSTASLILVAAGSCAATLWIAAISAAFAHWQTRQKRLGGASEWLGQPQEWLPPSTTRSASALVLAFALVPFAAFAANGTSGQTDQIAQGILATILPSIAGSGTAASHAIGILSSTLSLLVD